MKRLASWMVMVVMAGCVWGALGEAATYYVNSAGGRDGNSCAVARTVTTPKATIVGGAGCATAAIITSMTGMSQPPTGRGQICPRICNLIFLISSASPAGWSG